MISCRDIYVELKRGSGETKRERERERKKTKDERECEGREEVVCNGFPLHFHYISITQRGVGVCNGFPLHFHYTSITLPLQRNVQERCCERKE